MHQLGIIMKKGYLKKYIGKKCAAKHQIGIISDTHGLLRKEISALLQNCDAILHAGDVDNQEIIDKLNAIAPTYVVRGNNDKAWADNLPEMLTLELYGLRFLMVHNKEMIPENTDGFDIILYGHSHKYEETYFNQQLWLNPGSCGPRRFKLPVTMAELVIAADKSFRVRKVEIIEPHSPIKIPDSEKLPPNIKQIIISVIKGIERGIPVTEIARRNRISEALSEQICRLYLTHPGIDADGIMTKMELLLKDK